jgi:hypothetical protein
MIHHTRSACLARLNTNDVLFDSIALGTLRERNFNLCWRSIVVIEIDRDVWIDRIY